MIAAQRWRWFGLLFAASGKAPSARAPLGNVAAALALLMVANAQPGAAALPGSVACVNGNCIYPSIQAAFDATRDGDTITILAGEHTVGGALNASRVTIKGVPGTHLVGAAVHGKAALVLKGSDTVVEDIECSRSTVPDRDGACVRLEAPNLTLRGVKFYDNEMGILAGNNAGRVLIEDSLLERNGQPGASLGHNVYVNGGELVIRRSRILASRNEGHEVKSRAAKTTIEDSVIANLDTVDSRTIDVPNGGILTIRNSVIQMGPNSSNPDVIGLGLERTGNVSYDHLTSAVILENNIIISDRPRSTDFLHVRDVERQVVRGNTFIGGPPVRIDGNTWFPTREAAGLDSYPALPKPGQPIGSGG